MTLFEEEKPSGLAGEGVAAEPAGESAEPKVSKPAAPAPGAPAEESAVDVQWAALQKQLEAEKPEAPVTPEASEKPEVSEEPGAPEGSEPEMSKPEADGAPEEAKPEAPPKKKSPLRRALGVLGALLTAAVVALVLFMLATLLLGRRTGMDGVPFFGSRMFMVLSGSMTPAYPEGSVVFTREVPPGEIEPGDVITFYSDALQTTVTHRVVSAAPSGDDAYTYVTKGDANPEPDENPAYSWNVHGVVRFQVPYLGYAVSMLRTVWGLIFLVLLPCAIIIVVELIRLIRFSKE